jgi:hypothetical protein
MKRLTNLLFFLFLFTPLIMSSINFILIKIYFKKVNREKNKSIYNRFHQQIVLYLIVIQFHAKFLVQTQTCGEPKCPTYIKN